MDLSVFKNKHKGERGWVIAGGPSLKDIDPAQLQGEVLFGASLTFKHPDLHMQYQFIGDRHIATQFAEEISKASVDNLFVSKGIYDLRIIEHPFLYYFIGGGEKTFRTDMTKPIYGGGTSTFLCMQFAYYMGIKELYVIGLDHSWLYDNVEIIGEGVGGELMQNVNEDVNHFIDDFYPKNFSWYKPKKEKMAESYLMARKAFEANGRKIYNASTYTELPESILERINFEDVG